MACRSTPRASACRSAPRYWAIWMEKAVYSPTSTPCSSQVLELTMPMEAVASAPMWPTMAASMYSMAVTTTCSKMEGMLSISATAAVSRREISPPCRIRAESCLRDSVIASPVNKMLTKSSPIIIGTRKNVNPRLFAPERLIFAPGRDTLSAYQEYHERGMFDYGYDPV